MGTNIKITKKLESYIENFSYPLHTIQTEIINYNATLGNIKKMQIAVSQCYFLEFVIKTTNVKKILEIGTFTGLSTTTMALALPDDGNILSLDKNTETNKKAVEFFTKAKLNQKINTIISPALDSMRNLIKNKKKFDLVFIDADKINYKKYYDYAFKLIVKNGLIIIDNVLWHGEVADEKNNEKYTNIIRDFNMHVKNDNKTEQIIIPLGDGFSVCRKL
jgi:caffeoyl-CoA O-methyltransferase